MPRTNQLLALVALASLTTACTSPYEADVTPAPGVNMEAAEEAGPSIEPSRLINIVGELTGPQGEQIETAWVCLNASDICARVQADGGFDLRGIEHGTSELLQVTAPGYVPLAVPVGGMRNQIIDLEMVPDKTGMADSAQGAVRFVNRTMYGTETWPDEDAKWSLRDRESFRAEIASGSDPTIEGLAPGLYVAEVNYQAPASLCDTSSGWRTESPTLVVVPVVPGHITVIERTCLVIMN
ncbi:MAG: hypothetical protein KDA24_20175 [Deltaproteobacteria bacterium]|nr:hypothetical protein [Deltaproteobacteria bacterium]